MTTERFSKQQFEQVLSKVAKEYGLKYQLKGFITGEYWYNVTIKDLGEHGQVLAMVASSVGRSGFADAAGENSIRIWLSHSSGTPLGNKGYRWVNRVKGWETRLEDVLSRIIAMGEAIEYCKKCHTVEKAFIVMKETSPNKGKAFLKCNCGTYTWLEEIVDGRSVPMKEEVEDAPVKPIPANTKRIPKCPKCGGTLRLRERKGSGYGTSKFWSCSMYPACKFAMDATADGDVPDYEIKRHKLNPETWVKAGEVVKAQTPTILDVNSGKVTLQDALERIDEQSAKSTVELADEIIRDLEWKSKFAEREAEQEQLAEMIAHLDEIGLGGPGVEELAKERLAASDVAKANLENTLDTFNKNRADRAAKLVSRMVKAGADAPVEKPKNYKPSVYQKAVFDWTEASNTHTGSEILALVVEALAGSGKTTTALEILKHVPNTGQKIAFVAFNVTIKNKLAKLAPKHVKVMTYHGLGFAAIRKAFGANVEVDEEGKKVQRIIETILDKYTQKHLFPAVKSLVSHVKASMCGTSDAELAELAEYHDIELNGDTDTIFAAVDLTLKACAKQTNLIDYDDMIWMPVLFDLPCTQYDRMIVDELQDTNKAQIYLILKSLKPGGVFTGIGDRYQSIYGFRGADANAIPNVIEALKAQTLPLSITYRNPKKVVALVRSEFPHIPLEAAPWAEEGEIRAISENRALVEFRTGDMVLCRVNAPLAPLAMALIRKGVKAVIRGRDIGKGLTVLIRKMKANDLLSLIETLREYSNAEVTKLYAAEKSSQAISLKDKIDTIIALADGAKTISELEDRIENIFSDTEKGVVFSSVHRAKGEEAERVYILQPELMPHPMASKPWQKEQELNIKYVAYTRTLRELVFVSS